MTPKTKPDVKRYIGLDLSLTSPGFALIDVTDRIPRLVATTHYKTDADDAQPLRYELIESYALVWFREHLRKPCGRSVPPVAAVIREAWPPARNYVNNDKIHGAWSAVDRALYALGLAVTVNLSPTTVKKTVTGNGKAEKAEVAAAVRKWLRLADDYAFATDDESDAAAVILAHLIGEGLIDT